MIRQNKNIAATLIAFCCGLACASHVGAADYGVNLLVDGNAENGLNGWNSINSPAVVQYGTAGGFPTANDPGPPDRAKAFFAGGSNASSSLFQNIVVSANAVDIDAGKVACDISAWLGGFLNDGDNAQFDVHFSDSNGKDLLAITLGPVSAADRGGKTGLLNRVKTVAVPAKTRTILANIQMTRDPNNGGNYNDGYADSLSIVFRGPVVVTSIGNAGAGSLRDAIPRATVITFDPTVFAAGGAPRVVTLSGDFPDITQDLTITGPGSDILTVQCSPGGGGSYAFPVAGTNSLQPKVKIEALTMRGNVAAVSALKADLTLDHVVISDMPSGSAGALLGSSTVHLTNSAITRNKVGYPVFSTDSTVDIQSCTISANTSDLPAGVAIFGSSSTVSLTGCTISGNSGTASNSSIFRSDRSNLSLLNCTISDNSIPSGDTFFVSSSSGAATINLLNDTIAGNVASNSVHSDGTAKVTCSNTIFADIGATFSSTGGGSFISTGYNLSVHNDKTVLNQVSDQNSSDAMLGSLQNNGGPTFTRALLPGSFAIDKGNSILVIDQRGFPRPVDDPKSANATTNPTDIGAFEFQLPTATPTATSTATPTATPTTTPAATPGSLGNVSTRLQVGTGNNVLFAGFIVQGSGSKTLLIRSAGPSLSLFGVPGALGNPQLELHDANNTIATNDNWQSTQLGGVITSDQVAAIQNSGAAPSDPAEPGIIATVPAGGYTAIVQGVGGIQGVATVEVYDLSPNNGAVLANISTRGFIETGDNVMIGGFIVVGQSSKVLIRATGPSLVPFGINNALANPRLELHDGNGTLAANDDWQTTQTGGTIMGDQSAAIQSSELAPGNPAESAIIAILAPGNYTAIAQGVNGGTGVGLVEVFALP